MGVFAGCGQSVSVRQSIEEAIEEKYGDDPVATIIAQSAQKDDDKDNGVGFTQDQKIDVTTGKPEPASTGEQSDTIFKGFEVSGVYDDEKDILDITIDAAASNMEKEIFAIMDVVALCAEREDFTVTINASGAEQKVLTEAGVKDIAIFAKGMNLFDRDGVIDYMRTLLPDVYVDWYIDNNITSDRVILGSNALSTHASLTEFMEKLGAPASSLDPSKLMQGEMPDTSKVGEYITEDEINIAKEEALEAYEALKKNLGEYISGR